MLRYWPWLAAPASGALLAASHPGWGAQEWLAWLALTPIIAAIWFGQAPRLAPIASSSSVATRKGVVQRIIERWFRLVRHRVGRAAVLGYLCGLVFFWAAFSWLTTVTGFGWFILAFYMALYPAAWGAYLALASRMAGDFTRSGPNLRMATLGAASWVALEWVRGWLFSGFGWNNAGTALYQNLPFIQIAEYTGVGGLSFLLVFTNLIAVITVRRFIQEIRAVRIRPHWDFSINMVLIASVFLFGVRAIFAPRDKAGEIPLRVASIQPNIPQDEKFDPRHEEKIFQRLEALTEIALAWEPQLLLWPEAATPRELYADATNFGFVYGIAGRHDVNLLLGTLDFDSERRLYNIAALINERGGRTQSYRKRHLVPFGEYIPFREGFPLFAWIVGDLVPSDFAAGTEVAVMELDDPALKVGPLICFEDTLGELTRESVLAGAQCLVNLTNDGWFLESAAARQHLANAIFRAVENRRPLLRCTNTGVTAFIDPLGRITREIEQPFTEGLLTDVVKVPGADAPLTWYTRHGERFSKGCAWFSLLLLPLLIRRRRSS